MDKLNNKAWLLVKVLEKVVGYSIVESELFDTTKFKIKVPTWKVTMLKEPLPGHETEGWLEVDYHGEVGNRASISLPAPILDKGHEVSVNSKSLNLQRKI